MERADAAPPQGPNHALLVGEVMGTLAARMSVELVTQGEAYTDTLVIHRPSGTWLLRVAPEDVEGK